MRKRSEIVKQLKQEAEKAKLKEIENNKWLEENRPSLVSEKFDKYKKELEDKIERYISLKFSSADVGGTGSIDYYALVQLASYCQDLGYKVDIQSYMVSQVSYGRDGETYEDTQSPQVPYTLITVKW